MKSYINTLKRKAGFTLIELLVVIGILGILAAALIATIDPFEQLKKATDANVKNTTVELVNASIRYYTTHNLLPWSDPAAGAPCYNVVNPSGAQLTNAQMTDCLNELIADGELKTQFTSVSFLASIYVTGTPSSVTVCFLPISRSQLKDVNTKYTVAGALVAAPTTNCKGWNGPTTCYWCAL